MKFRKAIQLAILIFGVYGANINSMDSFDGDIFFHFFENSPENYDKEGLLWSNMFSPVQQMQQQPFNQQQLVQPQISFWQPTVMAPPSKPAPLVARRAIVVTIGKTTRKAIEMDFIGLRRDVRKDSCGCGARVQNIVNKLVVPQSTFINSMAEFLTHNYVVAKSPYFSYPKPSRNFLYSDIAPVAEKIRKYESVFSQVRDENMEIVRREKPVNDEFKERYLALTEAIRVLDVLSIKYAKPEAGQDGAFIFKLDFYTLNKNNLNILLPLDKYGLCAYPKSNGDSKLCIKIYEKRFAEVYNYNRPIIEQLSTREMLKDYDAMIGAIRETTIYSLLVEKQARFIESNSIQNLCPFRI